MPKEVELKIFVGPLGVELALAAALSRYPRGLLRHETDIYFNSLHRDFIAGEECLRLRIVNGLGELTWKPPTTDEMLARGQYWKQELNVLLTGEQVEPMRALLRQIDFVEYVTVDKKRIEFEFDDETKLALDVIASIGVFLEIETMSDDEARAAEKNESLLQTLNLRGTIRVTRPYRDIVKDALVK